MADENDQPESFRFRSAIGEIEWRPDRGALSEHLFRPMLEREGENIGLFIEEG